MEKNVGQRVAIIVIVLFLGLVLIYPPQERLRPGLDIAGGTSLIFEIDTTAAESQGDLAEKVKAQLQKRVDPKGVYNLNWRVHGRNRIEVQMPLPPKDAKERRDAYRSALDALYDHELSRSDIEGAIRLAPGQRDAALVELANQNAEEALANLAEWESAMRMDGAERDMALQSLAERIGEPAVNAIKMDELESRRNAIEKVVEDRLAKLRKAAKRYDEFVAARAALDAAKASTQPADEANVEELEDEYRDATELFEDSVEEVLRTNLNRRRFEEILSLEKGSDVRQKSLAQIRTSHADLRDLIEVVLVRHAEWRDGKQYLDGPNDLKRLMRGAGKLEFRILAEPDPGNPTQFDQYREVLREEGRVELPGSGYRWLRVDNPMQFFNLDSPSDLEHFSNTYKDFGSYVVERSGEDYYVLGKTGPQNGLLQDVKGQRPWKLVDARVDRDQHNRLSVGFTLDVVGGQMFENLTRRNIDKPLCILVDDVAYSAPNINSVIRSRGQITGDFSPEKVNYLVRTMEGGTLPARVKDTPLSERTIGSSLGETNRDRALRAGLIGGIAVAVIMLGYYLFTGVIANVALILNVLLLLSAMAMLNARITLVGIAGVILSVGMAVDANVLIFERIREERDRGASLRMMIKNGYDKALSTIFDSNITTLLTCVIIYYVGSEEVKGFGLTLGWGIVLNLFTSIFVTRTLFMLATKYNLIKDIKMLRLIGVPTIDWYSKRKIFLPISAIILVIGLSLLANRGMDAFDVEFRGGVAAEFEVRPPETGEPIDDVTIHAALEEVGRSIEADAEALPNVQVEAVPGELAVFTVKLDGVEPHRLAAIIGEPLEAKGTLEREGLDVRPDEGDVELLVVGEVTAETLKEQIIALQPDLIEDANNLADTNVNRVLEVGGIEQSGRIWNITTTVTNMSLVQHALISALGDDMRIEPSIEYAFHGENEAPYPVTGRLLDVVVPNLPPGVNADTTDYLGGAAMDFAELSPPQSIPTLRERIENMHFQPDFQDQPKRKFDVVGVTPADGTDEDGNPLYSRVVVLSVDPDLRYSQDPGQWETGFAMQELRLVETAFSSEQTLRKVMQFKPTIAGRSVQQASLALILSWAMIIGYLWIRFGRPTYGVAGVVALIHDACIALAFVGISGWIGGHDHPFVENYLLISDFKIDMTVVAALLTIIGYSINDTIVVFDRIRETRGRLGQVTPQVINDSINQVLARTIMTSVTTLIVLMIMYIFGGSSIRSFNFCMMIGIITGSYSSIAVASPLLVVKWLEWREKSARPASAT